MLPPPLRRAIFALSLLSSLPAQPVPYDIVYVRAPRWGDDRNTRWAEVFHPTYAEPGSDLMLLHPDGKEEVLFPAGPGAVADPVMSFDAAWVYFSYYPDVRPAALNTQRGDAPRGGADIYKLHLASRRVLRLTTQQWTPPSGASRWSSDHLTAKPDGSFYLGYGVFNLAPCPLPGGKLMFASSRDGYLPNKSFTFPNLRLYLMDTDGRNVEPVGHLNIGSALHPTVLADGRVMFASYEAQGIRDERLWGLWSVYPDGRHWEPLMSAFTPAAALHFQTQLSDGRIAVVEYYNLNNNGFGTLLAFSGKPDATRPTFGDANAEHASNPQVRRGLWNFAPGHPAHLQPRYKRYPFSPQNLLALTGFTHGEDEAAPLGSDLQFTGKVTHPAAAPGNDLLLVWTPGPANNLNRPTTKPYYDGGIYVLRGGQSIDSQRGLTLVKNDPAYNEQQPRPVVPYRAIYGVAQPKALPFLPNDGTLHPALPSGTPYGLVGTASFYRRDTAPGTTRTAFGGLDPFNTGENDANPNWFTQGADAGKYTNADIHSVRVVAMEGVAHRSYGPAIGHGSVAGFASHAGLERLRILGEIPLRKPGLVDGDGNPDTSFLAKISADTPFTFQTLDRDGLVLNMAQTWHQLRPGEVRTNCGGCHGHSQMPADFSRTAAGRGAVPIADLSRTKPIDVEFLRDIQPILQRSCSGCHSKSGRAEAGLVLDDDALINGYPGTYYRLTQDSEARFGLKPVINSKTWRQTNASRYIRKFQSRRSLLMWKIMGRRLDGFTNSDHPTERVPGDASTLPPGADPNLADLDYIGTAMPPPNSGHAPLSDEEKRTFARWIDLGCPSASPDPQLRHMDLFADELKPTLTLAAPRISQTSLLREIRLGVADAYSGIDRASLSVTASFAVNDRAANTELAADFREVSPGVWVLPIAKPFAIRRARITVRVKDGAGNESRVERIFSAGVNTPVTP